MIDPNCDWENNFTTEEDGENFVQTTSLRNIAAGEELFVDYGNHAHSNLC